MVIYFQLVNHNVYGLAKFHLQLLASFHLVLKINRFLSSQ